MNNSIPPSGVASWYNKRYSEGKEQSFGRPLRESIERLHKLSVEPAQARILDVGSGQGYFIYALSQAGHTGVGLDIAIEGVQVARGVVPDGLFLVADGQRLPFKTNSYDAVTLWGTLEHHADMAEALSECSRVAKPGGQIIARVPNAEFWVYLIANRLGFQSGTEQQDIIEHMLSQTGWQDLLEGHGLIVTDVQSDTWFLEASFSETKGLIQKVKLLLRKFSIGVAPLRYTYSFDFLCRVP